MASIGSLTVDLSLDSAEFVAGVKGAAQSTADSASSIKSSLANISGGFDSVSGAVKAFAGLFSVGALAAFSTAAIKSAADLQDAADKLGLTVSQYQSLIQGLPAELQIPESVVEAATALQDSFEKTELAIKNGFAAGFIAGFITQIGAGKTDLDSLNKSAADFGLVAGKAFGDVASAAVKFVNALTDIQKIEDELKAGGTNDTFKETNQIIGESIKETGYWIINLGFVHNAIDKLVEIFPGYTKQWQDWQAAANQSNQTVETAVSDLFNMAGALDAVAKAQENAAPTDSAYKQLLADTDAMEGFTHAQVDFTQAGLINREAFRELPALIKQSQSPLQNYQDQLAKIGVLYDSGKITAAQYYNLAAKGAADVALQWEQVAGTIAGALGLIFKNNKEVAIASAVINTAEAITKSIAAYGATPIGFAAAAAAAAMGAAQIASIESAQPGSSSTPSASTAAASTAKTGPAPLAGGPQQSINISLVGQSFGRAQVEGLVSQLKQYQKDGGTILLT